MKHNDLSDATTSIFFFRSVFAQFKNLVYVPSIELYVL